MGEIQVLSQDVANMIAAGEVVERPCSVVKELLENAVDAHASAITVEIHKGGTQRIRVTDNGSGIPPQELPRAFLRHATSKLQKAQDLEDIATLGFRGEALAAISAVSKVQVISATNPEDFAISLHLEGGNVVKEEEIASPVGTTMIVEDLFFNTPARKKFMKSERSEGSAIFSLVQELALSHPEISFAFFRDEKEELRTSGDGSLESAVFHVLGKNIAVGLRKMEYAQEKVEIRGFISLPSCCRPSRSFQHFFVNGRYIKSPMLTTAMEEGYRNQKMVGRFPSAVIHLNLPYDQVDVNVHPAKTQVKFAQEKEIFQKVHRAVAEALAQHKDIQKVELTSTYTPRNQTSLPSPPKREGLPSVTSANPDDLPRKKAMRDLLLAESGEKSRNSQEIVENIRENASTFQVASPLACEITAPSVALPFAPSEEVGERGDFMGGIPSNTEKIVEKKREKSLPKIDYNFNHLGDEEEETEEVGLTLSGTRALTTEEIPEENTEETSEKKTEETALQPLGERGMTEIPPDFEEIPLENMEEEPKWRVVGEFFRTYIAIEVGDEIFMVDKHAAHERMNFERLKSQNYKPMAQVLMKPIVVAVSPNELEILLENISLLEEFSFEIEEFSPQSIVVREAPYDIALDKVAETLLELARKLISGHFPDPNAARDHLLHSIACKAAIKAGYDTKEEERNLLAQIVMDDKVRHCPHGRPIVASLSKKDLEKKFKRIQ